jgi:hypothetical protein
MSPGRQGLTSGKDFPVRQNRAVLSDCITNRAVELSGLNDKLDVMHLFLPPDPGVMPLIRDVNRGRRVTPVNADITL